MLFCKDYREQVAAEVGSAAPNVVSKALGEKWGQTTDRHTWEKQAEKDKARYDKEMAAHTAMLDEEAAEVRRERDAYAAGPSDREAERSQKRQQMQEETAKREVRGRSNPGGEGGAEGCGGACGRGGGGGGREGEKAAARPVPSATFLAPRGPHPTPASPLDESNRDVPRTSTMHLPCIYHERAIHAFCYACACACACACATPTPVHACAGGAQEREEAEDGDRCREVARPAEQGSAGRLGVAGQPAARGEGGSARGCGARQRGAVAQGRGVQLPSQRRSGRRGRRGGSHGRPGAASAAAGPCQQLRARCAGRELSPCVGPLARRACEARLRGAPSADSAPRLCLRQAKKRLSFLLGQSELFKHFGLKDVKPPLTLAPS